MSRKIFAQVSVLALLLLAFLAIPAGVQAGGVCGGTYIVDAGDTLNSIAARCGTSVSAITTANPGVADPLRAGQTLTVPGGSPSGSGVTSNIVSSDASYNYNTYNNYTVTSPTVTYSNGTYIVQYGDTFSAIASRYGLSTNQLWAANSQIWNINYLYAGQLIYLPGYSTTSIATPDSLSYGTVPAGTPYGEIWLSNKSGGDVYVSLQGTTRDGIHVINEYSVSRSMKASVPAGWYTYVAWVGGQKYSGQFQLGQAVDHVLTFYNNKVSDEK